VRDCAYVPWGIRLFQNYEKPAGDLCVFRLILLLILIVLIGGSTRARGDSWLGREGNCFEWEGYWTVEQEQSGVWVGNIDYLHIGGPCVPPTNKVAVAAVRAVIAGEDFFAVRTSPSVTCHLHGVIRGERVRGYMLCSGSQPPIAFALSFARPESQRPK
jgi:hypothetical protein